MPDIRGFCGNMEQQKDPNRRRKIMELITIHSGRTLVLSICSAFLRESFGLPCYFQRDQRRMTKVLRAIDALE
ncbi:hypothetical protein RB195_025655 [Necator americanus]|uniref:Uncharacterized protein n=1 Tax=Necator americanus TaxID=51031 RepID=A0ABR1ETC8_NECAM